MFEATTGVATANASISTIPKLSPPSAGETNSLAARELALAHLVRDDPEHVDPVLVEAQPRVQQPVLERVGADQAQPGAGPAADLRPGAQQHRQALARVVAADEDDVVLAGPSASACSGTTTPFGTISNPRPEPARRPTRRPCARRRSGRRSARSGTPRPAAPPRIQPRSPAACQVATIGHVRERERGDADRGRHRLVQVDEVEPLLARAPRARA